MSALKAIVETATTAPEAPHRNSHEDPAKLMKELDAKLRWFQSLPEASRLDGMSRAKMALMLNCSIQFRAAMNSNDISRFDEIVQRGLERMAVLEAVPANAPAECR